jgi:hypothetical protein
MLEGEHDMDYTAAELGFNLLSLKDLLAAREQFHLHLISQA